MDPSQFDRLTRVFGARASRRAVFGLVIGGLLEHLLPPSGLAHHKQRDGSEAERGEEKTRDRTPDGPRQAGGTGERHGRDPEARSLAAERAAAAPHAEAACCSDDNCKAGPKKTLKRCCYEGRNLTKANFSQSNLASASFARATLRNANFTGAILTKVCFVDANLTGATFKGANDKGAIYCRTTMSNGKVNNGDCNAGTACCPTCDTRHSCATGTVCCNGRCVTGDCCASTDCADPARPICRANTCSPCGNSAECGGDKLCCDGRCQSGVCCQGSDCQPGGNTCTDNACFCGGNPACSGTTPRCCGDGAAASCRECCANAQCPPGKPFCDPEGECVACLQASDCPQSTNPCRERACTNGQCGTNPVTGGTCPFPGGGNGECADGQCVCSNQACDDGCCAAGQVCHANTDRCCTRTKTTCEVGIDCGEVPDGCGRTVICGGCQNPTPICGANHTCAACTGDGECGANSRCCGGSCFAGVCCQTSECPPRGNACVDHQCRCGAEDRCAAGATCCGEAPDGACVDTQTDRDHCGSCGQACPQGASCQGGNCVCPPATPDVCNNECVDLASDERYCGTCATTCQDATCLTGSCCPNARVCGATCLDAPCATQDTDCETFACDPQSGACVGTPAGAGTPCNNEAGVCNGSGACVECVTDAQCRDSTPVCNGSGNCACGDVCPSGCRFTTIQQAIDAFPAGSTIRLCPGTYAERITLSRNLTLLGAGSGTGGTVLDGAGLGGTVVTVATGKTATIQNLAVTRGTADWGGGIRNYGTLTLLAVAVTGNTATTGYGGGIRNETSGILTLGDGASVSGNNAASAGGLGGYGGGIHSWGAVTLQSGSRVTDNTARYGGAGIANSAFNASLTLENGSVVAGNTVTHGNGEGGGIDNGGTATLQAGSLVENNTAYWGGGILNDGTMVVAGEVRGNHGGFGGGINNTSYGYDGATLTLQDGALVSGNDASQGGGGICNDRGGSPVEATVMLLQAGSRVTNNTTAGDGGGILNLGGPTTVTLEAGSVVTGNTAANGGGIANRSDASSAATVTLRGGALVSGNTATAQGGGLFNRNDGAGTTTATLGAGSSVTGNTAAEGGGVYEYSGEVIVADPAIVTDNTANNCRPVDAVPICVN